MRSVRAVLLQLTSGRDVDSNFAAIRKIIQENSSSLVFRDSKEFPILVCLPENFAFFGKDTEKIRFAQEISEKTERFLSAIAREFGVYIVGGGYPVPSEDSGKCYNQADIYDPSGVRIFRYRKIHLFDTEPGDGISYQESKTTKPGSEIPEVVSIGTACKLTSLICYDLRFPEVFRAVSSCGAEVICVPAAFTVPTGEAHWEVLLRARAIENLCYVLAPAQVGENIRSERKGKSRVTYGNSMVVDPWGRILGRLDSQKQGILCVDLSGEVLEESRKRIPALKHRKF